MVGTAITLAAMRIQEVVRPNSLNFVNQRKVMLLRDGYGESWSRIASQVFNLKGERPSRVLVARVYKNFGRRKGRVSMRYDNCGRRPWKVTAEVKSFLVSRLCTHPEAVLVHLGIVATTLGPGEGGVPRGVDDPTCPHQGWVQVASSMPEAEVLP